MAAIRERIGSKGEKSYSVVIRMKDLEEQKTFMTREDAELFAFFREKLHKNMKAFEIPIKDRVRLRDVIEFKKEQMKDKDLRTICEFDNAFKRTIENIKNHTFLGELTFDDWHECLKNISTMSLPVRGNAITRALISPSSVRRLFATLSSAFSTAIASGIPIENYPLQIVQKYINPMIKKGA
jgi:hypothetical protein